MPRWTHSRGSEWRWVDP